MVLFTTLHVQNCILNELQPSKYTRRAQVHGNVLGVTNVRVLNVNDMLVQCELLQSCVGSINDKRRVFCVKGLIDKDLIEVEVDFFPRG